MVKLIMQLFYNFIISEIDCQIMLVRQGLYHMLFMI